MATNNTPYLEVAQLYKHYGEGEAKVTVLRDISTRIEKGQIYVLLGLSVPIFLIFIYLLTKTVIDRSTRAISYMKVFGYRDGETNKLYIRSITWTVVVSLGVPAADHRCVGLGIQGHADELQRNIVIYVPPAAMAECVLAGLATYAVVAFLHTRRIKRVPLALALKVQE